MKIASDLSGLFTNDEIKQFQSVAGLTQSDAKANLHKVSSIKTSKSIALKLSKATKARFAQNTFKIYPEAINLHPHCQGALLSLVYNRGNSLIDIIGQLPRNHMRDIQTHFKNKNEKQIAKTIDDMKSLWQNKGQNGLVTRREKEAEYFKKGLECECYK